MKYFLAGSAVVLTAAKDKKAGRTVEKTQKASESVTRVQLLYSSNCLQIKTDEKAVFIGQ